MRERDRQLTRRHVLKLFVAAPAAAALAAACNDVVSEPSAAVGTGGASPHPSATTSATSTATPSGTAMMPVPKPTYFTDDERAALGSLADAILPPDDQPGGSALGAVAFIEGLLTAFEVSPPAIFASGPFSDRNPFPNPDGTPSTKFSPNELAQYVPLDRYSDAAWRLTIYGSSGVTGGGPNDGVTGPIVGLRDQFRAQLAAAITYNGGPLTGLSAQDLKGVYMSLDKLFRETLFQLVCQAAFALPEYGGNPDQSGWKMVHFDGDIMPYGFSQWDATTSSSIEKADAPVSTPNPGADPEPIDDDNWTYVEGIVQFLGGKVYS